MSFLRVASSSPSVDEAALGRGVVRLAGQALDAAERGDIHDPAVLVQQHRLQDGPRDMEETVQVGIHNLLPLIGFHPDHQVVLADAGVVHKHLDILLRMGRLPAFEGRADRLRIAHVEAEQLALSADGVQRFAGRRLVRDVVDEDVIAHAGESEGDGAADAAAAAGDECGFHRWRIWFKVDSPRISRQVVSAVSATPSTPCRPQFWPVR